MVGEKLFIISHKINLHYKMICLTNLSVDGRNAMITEKSAPPIRRGFPGFASYKDTCFFYGGGDDQSNSDLDSVDMYTIQNDTW